MNYPRVLNEVETIERALRGLNLSRFGDGELRLATDGSAVSQRSKPARLVSELREILWRGHPNCLACIPPQSVGPRADQWKTYAGRKFVDLYGDQVFGSAFVTRPDNAPAIDNAAYWNLVRGLWRGEDVTLVIGTEKSLTVDMIRGEAKSVKTIMGPGKDAYSEIDGIEDMIGEPKGVVILCLGATATVLAWRLARKRVRAHDLGHIGMFMKRSESACSRVA